MKLYLYKNTQPNNYINKDNLNLKYELEGTLLNETSIINPQILVELNELIYGVVDEDALDVVDEDNQDLIFENVEDNNYLDFNYAFIEDFNRYYFITDVVCFRQNQYILSLRCDVLYTYKDYILELDAFVSRNEYTYNDTLYDEKMIVNTEKVITEYELDGNGPSKDGDFNPFADSGTMYMTYMSSFDGDEIRLDEYGSPVPVLNDKAFNRYGYDASNYTTSFNTTIYPTTYLSSYRFMRVGKSLLSNIFKDENTRKYILAAYVLPFLVPITNVSSDILVFNHNIKNGKEVADIYQAASCYECDIIKSFHYTIFDYTFAFASSFLDISAKYELYIPFYGYKEFTYTELNNKRIVIEYCITNTYDGSGVVYVVNKTDNILLFSADVTLGIQMPLSVDDYVSRVLNQKNNNISLAVKGTGSILSLGVGMASGNPFAIAGAITSGVAAIAEYSVKKSLNAPNPSLAMLYANNGYNSPYKVRLKISKAKSLNYDIDFKHLYGLPLNDTVKLNTLRGYTEVLNINLENLSSITYNEKQELESILRNGFYINN